MPNTSSMPRSIRLQKRRRGASPSILLLYSTKQKLATTVTSDLFSACRLPWAHRLRQKYDYWSCEDGCWYIGCLGYRWTNAPNQGARSSLSPDRRQQHLDFLKQDGPNQGNLNGWSHWIRTQITSQKVRLWSFQIGFYKRFGYKRHPGKQPLNRLKIHRSSFEGYGREDWNFWKSDW